MSSKQKLPGPLLISRLLAIFLLGRASVRLSRYYRVFSDLFSIMGEHQGFLNIGYSEDPQNEDLLTAQKALVRRTTRNLAPIGRWLEAGCGTGEPARLLAQEHEDLRITGIDLRVPVGLEARDSADRVEIHCGDAAALPFKDSAFNGAYAIETAFHYPDKAAFVREAYRVLVPGGGLAVADVVWKYNRIPFHHGPRTWFWRRLMASPQIFTAEKWKESLAVTGFQDIRVEDISRQTLGLAPRWHERVKAHQEELADIYTGFLVDLGVRFFVGIGENLPLTYILVTARKS